MASLPDGSFGREYLRFLEDNVSVRWWDVKIWCFVSHWFHQVEHISSNLSSFTFHFHFPVLSACDPWYKGRCEVCGRWGISLRHAEIQRGPWFVAHLTGHAHQHAGWVRLHVIWKCCPDCISHHPCPAEIWHLQMSVVLFIGITDPSQAFLTLYKAPKASGWWRRKCKHLSCDLSRCCPALKLS